MNLGIFELGEATEYDKNLTKKYAFLEERNRIIMTNQKNSIIEDHIKTHSERSAEDCAAVRTLEFFLRSKGKINTNFASNDKWPNTDGTFEFLSNLAGRKTSEVSQTRHIINIAGHSKMIFSCSAFEAEHYYYNNALKTIKNIAYL